MDRFRYLLVTSALVSGSLNTLGLTLQNRQPVLENDVSKHFFHPYMQVVVTFFASVPALFAYLWLEYRKSRKAQCEKQQQDKDKSNQHLIQSGKTKPHLLLYLIPTVLDYLSTICYLIALNFIPASVYQNLRGGVVLTTFLFEYTCLRLQPTRPRIVGCLIVMIGLVEIGAVNYLMSNASDLQKEEILIGYALILIALFGNGLHFVYEAHLLAKYEVEPLFMVGIEGLYGMVISFVLIPLLQLMPCSFGEDACVIDDSGSKVVQNASIYFSQVFDNCLILLGVVLNFFSMATYNTVGVSIAKYINSVARALCDVTRIIFVWGAGIIITLTLGEDDPRYRWESLEGGQILGLLVGFIILIFGNLVYYDIIEFHCTKEVKEQEEPLMQADESESNQVRIPSAEAEPGNIPDEVTENKLQMSEDSQKRDPPSHQAPS